MASDTTNTGLEEQSSTERTNSSTKLESVQIPEQIDSVFNNCVIPENFKEFAASVKKEDFAPNPDFCCKIGEENRLDKLLRMRTNMTEYFDNTAYVNPYGQSNYEYGQLPPEKQLQLEHLKMKSRRENYKYLAEHPELDAMLEIFLGKVVKEAPDNPVQYAAEHFCQCNVSTQEYQDLVDMEVRRIRRFRHTKNKEFLQDPRTDATETIRQLNVGPFAHIFKDIPKATISTERP